jgi:hypothetical protein
MSRSTSAWAVFAAILVTWWVIAPTRAQSGIPDGVFVRDSDGTVWLVMDGRRVSLAIWTAPEEDIRALPVGDRWAVMNDDGAIVAGDRPGWYLGTSPDSSSSQPVLQSPIRTGSSSTSASSRSSATATPTPTPVPDSSSSTSSSAPTLSAGAKAPVDGKNCPTSNPIKANKSSIGELIYHVPGGATYASTVPDECFSTRAAAEAAGYHAAVR